MTYQPADISDATKILPPLPDWVTLARTQTPEDVAFLSGAALGHLHLVVAREEVPHALLRARLALRAAEACVTFAGRCERAGDLRDAVAFLQPGDRPGPAGDLYLSWRRAAERPVSAQTLRRALPDLDSEPIAAWLGTAGAPVTRAAATLEAVLRDRPRDPAAALVLADAALARALGWTHVTPLLAHGLRRGDVRRSGEDLRAACHRALVKAVTEAVRDAAALARRSARLQHVAPKLRAKGAEEAVAMFLTRDAVAPAMLASLRSGRAARRFCDRLVALGAVRELTGRDTFRLYGV